MISAARPFDLMLEKLLGIGAAAFTQFQVWMATVVVLTAPRADRQLRHHFRRAVLDRTGGIEVINSSRYYDGDGTAWCDAGKSAWTVPNWLDVFVYAPTSDELTALVEEECEP